ncbi:MAG TPA: CpsB/CapC family capsule biosynthesis tyrosine phosphatase [Polyangia bacterium]|nr:CpsB/CapC family capsule biosynthesis tyrosine phosphatase [Polyangia bacterium]
MPHYVDLHSHYLPALDDGATSLEMSLQMMRAIASLGFSHLYATPHQREGMFMPERPRIDAAYAAVKAALADAGGGPTPAPTLGLAAENFWDSVFHDRLRAHAVPTYDATPAFLFEVNTQMMPVEMENQLFQIRTSGYVPVMAHPERYVAVQRDPSLAERLGRHAAMLIDLGALDGAHGKAELKTARKLVLEGLAHGAASDIHRPEDQAGVAAGMAWIRKQRGQAVLDQMLDENPRRLLAGELPDAPRA